MAGQHGMDRLNTSTRNESFYLKRQFNASCPVLSKQKHACERQNTWLKNIIMTLLPCILVLL